MNPAGHPYPLLFTPMFYEKVWGGRALERVGKVIPAGKPIGESWELADMPSTSASGAGGGSARSTIINGHLAGKSLGDAVAAWGPKLLGSSRLSDAGGFPLLIKYLDACENLSVQVHPSPAYAARHRDAKLKTECWYILHAEPGAVIYKGIKPGITPETFAAHIRDGSVANDMIAVPAVVGECHNLPSGTCHALGAGVLVAEVQTPSDTTFRVFDWGRSGRELHIQQALECIDFGPAPAAARAIHGQTSSRLVTTEYFTLDELNADRPVRLKSESRAQAIMLLEGHAELRSDSAAFATITLTPGSTALVPAAIVSATTLAPIARCKALHATVLG